LIQRVKARREVILDAEGLTPQNVERLVSKLGDVPWKMQPVTPGAPGTRTRRVTLNIADSTCSLLQVLRAADQTGIQVTTLSLQEPNLETVFLELTGRMLRD